MANLHDRQFSSWAVGLVSGPSVRVRPNTVVQLATNPHFGGVFGILAFSCLPKPMGARRGKSDQPITTKIATIDNDLKKHATKTVHLTD